LELSAWIGAFRLRTLPLALSTILLGSFIALSKGVFNFRTFSWAIITTLFLQILSNLANDLGDSLKGTDGDGRIGPQRAVQSGAISKTAMKRAVIFFAILALLSGLRLLQVSFEDLNWLTLSFFVLGLLAIGAAVNYTLGSKPYGYLGLGDLFVFLFFGILGVFGSFYLHSLRFDLSVLLPASSIGLMSVAVLNMNNMRDIHNDADNGKRTIVVKMGFEKAKGYHAFLIIGAFLCSLLYLIYNWESVWLLLALLAFPFFFRNLAFVLRNNEPSALNPELKKLALSTLIYSISFGLAITFF
jgi:1,4-dihydroxy-2-naphthoate octaprenyltransferase